MAFRGGLRRSSTLTDRVSSIYRPLLQNEIRLLELQPGGNDDPVECNIQHVSLREKPKYHTLSYCWGVSDPVAELYCQKQRLGITRNLSSALKSLRHEVRPRHLWVDAVCIDQESLQERASQVQLMADIFRQSEETSVWLGESSETSSLAIQKLEELANLSSAHVQNHSVETQRQKLARNFKSSLLPAVYTLLKRPWFTRTWVIQEVAVANNPQLICGRSQLSWDKLFQAVLHLLTTNTYFAYPGHPIYQIVMLARMRRDFQSGILPPLLNNLQRSRTFEASDARDKIFALLGLSDPKDVQRLNLQPNYQVSADDLYRHVAMSMLKSNHRLDLFSAVGAASTTRIKLPSWVPDWSAPNVTVPLSFRHISGLDHLRGMESFPSFQATGDSVLSSQSSAERDVLGISGIVIDRITAVGSALEYGGQEGLRDFAKLFTPSTGVIAPLGEWEKLSAAHSKEKYITGENRLDVFWTTLCAGHWPGDDTRHNAPRVGFWVKMVKRHRLISWLAFKIIRAISREDLFGKVALRTLEAVHWVTSRIWNKTRSVGIPPPMLLSNQRRMIRTAKGYIGLAPLDTRVEDVVVLLKGGRVPYVLKPRQKDYTLAGECYVHGIMQGEQWDDAECITLCIK